MRPGVLRFNMPGVEPVLTLSADPVWARVPAAPARRTIPVVIDLAASDEPVERARPRLSICLVLDVSGSMAGPPLDQVVKSVEKILGLLREDDRLGIVAFSTRATVVSEMASLDAPAKRAIASRVARLFADGRTNVEAGLTMGASLFDHEPPPPSGVATKNAIVLLSDGEPNEGACTKDALHAVAQRLRAQASISTLGYGIRHDEEILLAVAEGGAGAYRFIADPGVAQLELAQAIGAQGDIAIEGIDLSLVPEPGVEIERVVGAGPPRFSNDGLLVAVPDLPAHATRTVAVDVATHFDRERLTGKLLTVVARYRRAGRADRLETVAAAQIDVGGVDPVFAPAALAKALLVRADAVRADARALADRGQFEGAAAVLRRHMKEIESAPGYRAGDGSALSEAWEQLLDEAMAFERRPAQEALSALKASTMTRSLSISDGIRASSRPLGKTSRGLSDAMGGTTGEAHVLVVRGPTAGVRHKLGPQNTLGRTTSSDVPLPSAQVSRRHADIFFLEGDFFIADLGSTNVTSVNGVRLDRAPQPLKNGDRIRVGDVDLLFERRPNGNTTPTP